MHVIVLDLDGVVVKSNFIKYHAMLSLFDSAPEHGEAIGAFILSNGGVPRKEKISAILEKILGIQATPAVVSEYLTRYDANLADLLYSAPLVEGVAEFVARSDYTFYISSSAPEDEVESQLARTGLLPYFSGIFGRDTAKATALSEVKRRHKDLMPVFFGDSIGDLRAAQEADVAFIAVVCERDNFGDLEVIKIKDFTSMELVQQCINDVVNG